MKRPETTKIPTYLELIDKEFYRKHVCRLEQWPEEVVGSFARLNYKLYDLMQGPSEFKVGGRIIDWDITPRLGEIGDADPHGRGDTRHDGPGGHGASGDACAARPCLDL